MTNVWDLVHAERDALIADLEQLPSASWEQGSLCEGWTVHDVVAHLVDSALTTRLGFAAALVRARFDFHRLNENGLRRRRGATPQETLEGLRRAARSTATPPAPLDSRLVEEVVHGEDIRRPLGLSRDYPQEAVERAIRSQASTPTALGGGKDLVAQVRLESTDADFAIGEGPAVTGPSLSLLLVLSGRRAALDDLGGPGLDRLARQSG